MSTVSQGNIKKLLKSFSFAIEGIFQAVKTERNLKIHFSISIIVIVMGFLLSLTKTEWLFIVISIGGVISLELVNTAIERTVDLFTKDYQPLAKQAKDIAAGAVFVYAILSVVVGLIIFAPKLWAILF